MLVRVRVRLGLWLVRVGYGWLWLGTVGYGWSWLGTVGFGWLLSVTVGYGWSGVVRVGSGWLRLIWVRLKLGLGLGTSIPTTHLLVGWFVKVIKSGLTRHLLSIPSGQLLSELWAKLPSLVSRNQ